jgi:hypothetical protein
VAKGGCTAKLVALFFAESDGNRGRGMSANRCLPVGDMRPGCASCTARGVPAGFANCAHSFSLSKCGEDRASANYIAGHLRGLNMPGQPLTNTEVLKEHTSNANLILSHNN